MVFRGVGIGNYMDLLYDVAAATSIEFSLDGPFLAG